MADDVMVGRPDAVLNILPAGEGAPSPSPEPAKPGRGRVWAAVWAAVLVGVIGYSVTKLPGPAGPPPSPEEERVEQPKPGPVPMPRPVAPPKSPAVTRGGNGSMTVEFGR